MQLKRWENVSFVIGMVRQICGSSVVCPLPVKRVIGLHHCIQNLTAFALYNHADVFFIHGDFIHDVFYSTFTNVFIFVTFYVFNVF